MEEYSVERLAEISSWIRTGDRKDAEGLRKTTQSLHNPVTVKHNPQSQFVGSWDSHLGGSGPPALVSHAEAAQALSLGHLVLPRALVLPAAHGGCGFVLQL